MKPNLSPAALPEPASILRYFTETSILRRIGHRRLALLLKPFEEELSRATVVLPEPGRQNDDYFADFANALSRSDRLPTRLRQTLLTIELAASPENEKPLWCALKRRIPSVSVADDCALDRALELWFAAPEEFSTFPSVVPKPEKEESPRPSDGRGIKGEGEPVIAFPNETEDQTYERLARLCPGDYDRARQPEATRLGIRKETLDSEVAKRRLLSDDAQGRAVHLPSVEPWPEPVNGAEVLDQVSARFTLQLVLPPGAADAIALWEAHAHAPNAFVHTPRLNLSSLEPGCGKTTTLDLIATMTPRSLRTENLTAPSCASLPATR